mmetsp:Transcript_134501/g.261912  ORF Transcript_134501/g.261912 Transcript_134501/m.261912 type:complete len:92 (+) Transcript_134501:553-828(+)
MFSRPLGLLCHPITIMFSRLFDPLSNQHPRQLQSPVPSSSHDFTVMKSLNRDYFCTADPLNITYSSLVILLHSCVVAGDVQEATDINSACL